MTTQEPQQQQQPIYQNQEYNSTIESRILDELSTLVFKLLRPPRMRRTSPATQMNAAGFAWLMAGVSVALMVCGSVTFLLGFMLMPWVIGIVMVFYVVGFVSTVSVLCRYLLCYAFSPSSSPSTVVISPPSPRKEIPAWKLL